MAFYKRGNEDQMRHRVRLTDELVKQHGLKGYKCVSLLDMEYADDEEEYLQSVLQDLKIWMPNDKEQRDSSIYQWPKLNTVLNEAVNLVLECFF